MYDNNWSNWFGHTSLQGRIFGIRLLPQCREQFMTQSKNNKERSGKTVLTCLDITDFLYKPKKKTTTTALCVSEGEKILQDPRTLSRILRCCPSMSFQLSSNHYTKFCIVTSWDHQFCINISMCLWGHLVLLPFLRYCWLDKHSSTWYTQTQTLPQSISKLQNVIKIDQRLRCSISFDLLVRDPDLLSKVRLEMT